MAVSFSTIGDDLLLLCLRPLDPHALLSIRSVNRDWHVAASSDELWGAILRSKVPAATMCISNHFMHYYAMLTANGRRDNARVSQPPTLSKVSLVLTLCVEKLAPGVPRKCTIMIPDAFKPGLGQKVSFYPPGGCKQVTLQVPDSLTGGMKITVNIPRSVQPTVLEQIPLCLPLDTAHDHSFSWSNLPALRDVDSDVRDISIAPHAFVWNCETRQLCTFHRSGPPGKWLRLYKMAQPKRASASYCAHVGFHPDVEQAHSLLEQSEVYIEFFVDICSDPDEHEITSDCGLRILRYAHGDHPVFESDEIEPGLDEHRTAKAMRVQDLPQLLSLLEWK